MRGWVGWCFAAALAAQQTAPTGIVRGTLLERDRAESGEFTVRAADSHTYRFRFDAGTYVEKDDQRAAMADLEKGEMLEIVSDQGAGPFERYARIVKAVSGRVPARPSAGPSRRRAPAALLDDLFPRGNLTFAGVVAQVSGNLLVLRTRVRGQTRETRILLRPDTRYLHNGVPAEASALAANMRVFVRGGESLDNGIEAYQVIWGEILKPD
jgi:hypothetical protein